MQPKFRRAGGDGDPKRVGDGFAVVEGDFNRGNPGEHGTAKNSGGHGEGRKNKTERHGDPMCHVCPVLCEKVKFKHAKRQQVLGERDESGEWARECNRIKTDGASKDEEPSEKRDSEKPDCTHHEEKTQGPATMRSEIASKCRAQGESGKEPDQDSIQRASDVLRNVANGSAEPCHVCPRQCGRNCGEHVDTPVPTMKDGGKVENLGNELRGSGEHAHYGEADMKGGDEVAGAIAGNVAVRHEAIPGERVATGCRASVEGRDRSTKDELAENGHPKPEAGSVFQGGVGEASQVEAIGPESAARVRAHLDYSFIQSCCLSGWIASS